MWAIISMTNKLKFYNFDKKEFCQLDELQYKESSHGYRTEIIEIDDNGIASILLANGISIFQTKKDIQAKAIPAGLTGYKYFQLNPSVLKI